MGNDGREVCAETTTDCLLKTVENYRLSKVDTKTTAGFNCRCDVSMFQSDRALASLLQKHFVTFRTHLMTFS